MTNLEYALVAEGLRVETPGGDPIVADVSLRLGRGEVMGLVGESGSGKSTTALALMGHASGGGRIASGSVRMAGENLLSLPTRELRRVRGHLVSYVPQNPAAALNPAMRVGTLIREVLNERCGGESGAKGWKSRALEALARAGLQEDGSFLRCYPHQLSGGQQQRVVIAAALASNPEVLVLDEPTTALDVITQAAVLGEIKHRVRESGTTVVYLSHDLGVVGSLADRITVLYAGSVVEEGPVTEVLEFPRHPYTRALLAAFPRPNSSIRPASIVGTAPGVGERPTGCTFVSRCGFRSATCEHWPELEPINSGSHAVRCWEKHRTADLPRPEGDAATDGQPQKGGRVLRVESLRAGYTVAGKTVETLGGIDLDLASRECLAVVGESGSGKSTLARCIVGLHPPSEGGVTLGGAPLARTARERSTEQLGRTQLVFQDPSGSLSPLKKVGVQVARPAEILRGMGRHEAEGEARRLLEAVRLPWRFADRLPCELSGGERQRAAIARALAAGPEVMVCDEITSSLDVSVQAVVLDLLGELRTSFGLGLIFITHDLSVVAGVADRVAVMEDGEIVEADTSAEVLRSPKSTAARTLLAASKTSRSQENEPEGRKK